MTVADYFTRLSECGAAVEATASGAGVTTSEAMERCLALIDDARLHGGTVHLVGNGGSAAIVSHAQNDFVKAAWVRAQVHQDIPLLTACANDEGYRNSVARPLQVWLKPKDVLIAVSSSGMSDNIVDAVHLARNYGARSITCSGFREDNRLRTLGDVNFYVPSSDYGQVELTHAALLHYLTDHANA